MAADDLLGGSDSWHWVRGSLQSNNNSGWGRMLAGEASQSSLCLHEELSCPPLSTRKVTVGRRHRGQTGDREPGCSRLKGWTVAGLEGPQEPVLPPITLLKSQREQCICSGSHSKLAADQGAVLRAPTSQPGETWIPEAPREVSGTEVWWGLGGGCRG